MNAKFDSNISALNFLKEYQETYSSVTGLPYIIPQEEISKLCERLFENEEFVKKIKVKHNISTIEEFKKLFISPFSKEEDYLRHLSRQIVQFNNLENNYEIASIPVGTLPTNDFNASAIKTDNGERVIVLNSGIVVFMSEVINSFLGTLSTSFLSPLWTFNEAAVRIIQSTTAFSSGAAKFGLTQTPTFTNPELIMASGSIGDTARIFILAHEYGHFLLGHFDDSITKVRQLIPNSTSHPIEFYIQQQEQEFEADVKGFELCIEWCKKTHNGNYQIAYLSIILAFHLINLIEINTTISDEALTHPPSSLRRKKFEDIYFDNFDEEIKSEINYLDDFMNKIIYYMEKLKYQV